MEAALHFPLQKPQNTPTNKPQRQGRPWPRLLVRSQKTKQELRGPQSSSALGAEHCLSPVDTSRGAWPGLSVQLTLGGEGVDAVAQAVRSKTGLPNSLPRLPPFPLSPAVTFTGGAGRAGSGSSSLSAASKTLSH